MIVASLLLQAAAPPVPLADEVTVIAQRQKTWRGNISGHGDRVACKTRQSSGDAEIDAIGCRAMEACWPDAKVRYDATADKHLDKATRKTMLDSANHAYGQCLVPKRDALIAQLADRRAAARMSAHD